MPDLREPSRFVERKKKGGWVDITLDLIEAGTKAPMAATIDTARLVEDEADNTLPVLADDFGHGFDADGPSFLADDALGILGEAGGMLGQISGRLAVVGRPLGLVQRGLSSFTGNLSSLIGMPSLLGGQLQGLMAVAVVVRGFGHGDRRRCRHGQQAAAAFQLGGAAAVGEEAIVANAVKAVGQDVEQEAADEFAGLQRHHLLFVVMAIVLPAEADAAVIDRDQAAVGDGDTMGVPIPTPP
ncbi:hypothetical protein A6A05_11370 [Magnetospirillum moscoviense]|uniref:Uncharacterized protein n=1 Tax=Magnetospirillum moscoviense TaxID=1437059 RepID=A0A178MSF9_9PROT|nr:hypothetical protein A6A05_11370 [Magnetospirillum moscoviense]